MAILLRYNDNYTSNIVVINDGHVITSNIVVITCNIGAIIISNRANGPKVLDKVVRPKGP